MFFINLWKENFLELVIIVIIFKMEILIINLRKWIKVVEKRYLSYKKRRKVN